MRAKLGDAARECSMPQGDLGLEVDSNAKVTKMVVGSVQGPKVAGNEVDCEINGLAGRSVVS